VCNALIVFCYCFLFHVVYFYLPFHFFNSLFSYLQCFFLPFIISLDCLFYCFFFVSEKKRLKQSPGIAIKNIYKFSVCVFIRNMFVSRMGIHYDVIFHKKRRIFEPIYKEIKAWIVAFLHLCY